MESDQLSQLGPQGAHTQHLVNVGVKAPGLSPQP